MNFPNDLKKRNQYILDRVRDGSIEIEWVPITYAAEGNVGIFTVTADALKIDGVRVNVTAFLQQQIADVLDCSLLTPRLADLIHLNAEITIDPCFRPIDSSTQVMIDQSKAVDAKIPEGCGGKLVSTVGKHWVLDAQLDTVVGKAVNYGWHVPTSPYKGVKAYNGTLPGIKVIQPNATAHNPQHTDYSQVCVLVRRSCQINGTMCTLDSVLSDPALASLVSHQGPLRVHRQPGI